ncbi:hypothetical protein QTP88_010249 [Uroleucon formosanum]
MTLFALADVLSVTLPASRLLQSYDRDIAEASDIIDDIILTLSGKRSNCESEFSKLFEQSKNVMNKLDIDLKLPRIAKRQTQRSNNPAQSLEEYYCRAVTNHYAYLDINILEFQGKIELLKTKWVESKNELIYKIIGKTIPENVLESITQCNKILFPGIRKILIILATLPVSVASAESFSTLRRLKTWLRSQIGQERLTGLALLHVHCDIELNA